MAVKLLKHQENHPMFIGESLATAAPPYDFDGVTLRYFPLKANFRTLANFCDDYLNVIPPEIAYFRPAMPFALLMIVNYGRMSVDAGNLGWTSQNELLFSIPLEWYRKIDGKMVFQDTATIAPYIFVDSESSQSAGREVLGWPKVQGWFTRDIDSWARHPRNRREVLTLTTRVFENLYEDETNVAKELLVVEEDPAPTFSEFPPDTNNPLNPLLSIPRAITGWANLAGQTMSMMARLPINGYSEIDRSVLTRLPDMLRSQQAFGQSMQGNTINLKQMRDAGRPGVACYQAITNARMEVTQFHRGGMLGDIALLRGDTSGGYRIRLNQYESQPIIDVLGLEVDEERTQGQRTTAYLKPVMPFWQEMDLRYLEATNLCWRTAELDWRNDEVEEEAQTESEKRAVHRYNTTGSAGLQVATGPFQFDDSTIRVLPFLADKSKLQKLVDEHLPEGTKKFEVYGNYVYMLVFSYGKMYSETNNMGDWASKTVEFAVPVRCRDRANDDLESIGYVCPFLFNNSSIGVTTGREVYGWPVVEADIKSPRNLWLEGDGPASGVEPYMNISAEVFPALNLGQESEWRSIVELDRGVGKETKTRWDDVADGWGSTLKRDVARMSETAESAACSAEFTNLQALALELLGNGQPFNQYSFKQVRDAQSSDKACYQSLVRRPTQITRLQNIEEIDDQLLLKIHRYPTHPIADMFGLIPQSSYLGEHTLVDCFQPSRPFFLKADLRIDLPTNICWRSLIGSDEPGSDKTEGWNVESAEKTSGYFFDEQSAGVGRDLVQCLNGQTSELSPSPFGEGDQHPDRIQHKCKIWQDAVQDRPAQDRAKILLSTDDAQKAVSTDQLEPQMVVHAMLSNEWNCTREKRRTGSDAEADGKAGRLPNFVIPKYVVGDAENELFADGGPAEDEDFWTPGQ